MDCEGDEETNRSVTTANDYYQGLSLTTGAANELEIGDCKMLEIQAGNGGRRLTIAFLHYTSMTTWKGAYVKGQKA